MNRYPKVIFLFNILKPYSHFVLLVIFFSIFASAFDGISIGLLVPLMSNLQNLEETEELPAVFQWIVEMLGEYAAGQQIIYAMLMVLVAIVLKNIFIAASMKLGYWLSARLVADLREKAVNMLMQVGIDFHHKSSAGELIERTINNTARVEFLMRVSVEFFANLLTFLVLFSMLFLLSWQLTLFTAVLGSFFVLFVFYYTKSFRKIGKKSALAEQGLMQEIHQSLSGILLIKSHSKEKSQEKLLKRKINASRKADYRRNFKVFSLNPATDVLASIVITILFIGAMFMYGMNTKLMLAELLPFVYILLRIVPLVKHLHSQRAEIHSRWPYVGMIYDLLQREDKPFLSDGEKLFTGLKKEIRFQGISFSYDSEKENILQNVNFFLPSGKTTAVVGDSGAGKSTIVNLLLRLYDPQQGNLLIDGRPLPEFQLASWHAKIGIVSQETFLFNHSIKFNIAFGAEKPVAGETIIAAAKKAGAHDFIMAMPGGYETEIGDRGVRLSGGQRQRLAIARAIIRDPQILILDEATSSLDTVTERRIHDAISELSKGRTVIIIAHRLSTIQNADQIVVLKNGRVAEIGEAGVLLDRKGEYYKLVNAN